MLNGKMLKMVFLSIMASLLFIMLASVVRCLVNPTPENWNMAKEICGFFGIPTLIGVIVQKVLNLDEDHDGVPDVQEIDDPEPIKEVE